jgi:hypothetical protein
MRMLSRASVMILAGCMMTPAVVSRTFAGDDPARNGEPSSAVMTTAAGNSASQVDEDLPPLNLLDAMKKGQVAVQAEGRSDGRVTVS